MNAESWIEKHWCAAEIPLFYIVLDRDAGLAHGLSFQGKVLEGSIPNNTGPNVVEMSG